MSSSFLVHFPCEMKNYVREITGSNSRLMRMVVHSGGHEGGHSKERIPNAGNINNNNNNNNKNAILLLLLKGGMETGGNGDYYSQ